VNSKDVMVEVRGLTKAYGNNAPAIRDLSLSFKRGEFVVLLGPSGVGKSTLLRCLNHLVRPTAGTGSWTGRTWVPCPEATCSRPAGTSA
jgi:phosphonate transport system ATP-binding protein